MESIILKKIIKGALSPIPKENITKISKLLETCICKIHKKNELATGFFTKINYKSKVLKFLEKNL